MYRQLNEELLTPLEFVEQFYDQRFETHIQNNLRDESVNGLEIDDDGENQNREIREYFKQLFFE
jgi:hypothetical protein